MRESGRPVTALFLDLRILWAFQCSFTEVSSACNTLLKQYHRRSMLLSDEVSTTPWNSKSPKKLLHLWFLGEATKRCASGLSRKNDCKAAANPFSVPKSVINSIWQPPTSETVYPGDSETFHFKIMPNRTKPQGAAGAVNKFPHTSLYFQKFIIKGFLIHHAPPLQTIFF